MINYFFVSINPFTIIATIIPFILLLFVRIQLKNHQEITQKELKHLKICSIIGMLLFIPCIIPLALILSLIPEMDIELYFEELFSTILLGIICIIPAIIIFIANFSSLKKIKLRAAKKNIVANNKNVQPAQEKVQDDAKSIFDFYALLIALATLPIQIYLYVTNLSEEHIDISMGDARAKSSWKPYITEYYFPDEIKSTMIILAFAFLIISMFLIHIKGKNTSNKATWVKIINVINVIGQIILFIAIDQMTS